MRRVANLCVVLAVVLSACGSSKGDRTASGAGIGAGGLARLGYNPGPVDGVMGPQTSEAIQEYQRDHGLLIDGRPTVQLAEHVERRI